MWCGPVEEEPVVEGDRATDAMDEAIKLFCDFLANNDNDKATKKNVLEDSLRPLVASSCALFSALSKHGWSVDGFENMPTVPSILSEIASAKADVAVRASKTKRGRPRDRCATGRSRTAKAPRLDRRAQALDMACIMPLPPFSVKRANKDCCKEKPPLPPPADPPRDAPAFSSAGPPPSDALGAAPPPSQPPLQAIADANGSDGDEFGDGDADAAPPPPPPPPSAAAVDQDDDAGKKNPGKRKTLHTLWDRLQVAKYYDALPFGSSRGKLTKAQFPLLVTATATATVLSFRWRQRR